MRALAFLLASLAAAADLFEAGMADPRGGEYREVEFEGQKTEGWAFPDGRVVTWSGLSLRSEKVGRPARLESTARAMLSAPAPDLTSAQVNWEDLRHPAVAALLLERVGRADLVRGQARGPVANALARKAWLGAGYKRLIGLRLRGEHRAAVSLAESLQQWQARSVSMETDPRNQDAFLAPVPDLLADSRRRLREAKRGSTDFDDLRAVLDFSGRPQSERISELISRLDEVRHPKLFGADRIGRDRIHQLLAKEGDTAVDPLLDTWASDKRLTLGTYDSPFVYARPVSVREIAKEILGDLLHPSRVDDSTPEELRKWWRRQPRGPFERAYALLRDDAASRAEWLISASDIVARPPPCLGRPEPEARPPGEVLRSRQSPSVTELLSRRSVDLAAGHPPDACHLAFLTYLWDPQNALPALQNAGRLKECKEDSRVVTARLALGDKQAALDWADHIRTFDNPHLVWAEPLSPMWMFPSDPVVAQVTEWLLLRPDSLGAPALREQIIHSPLLAVEGYRKALLAALQDPTIGGTAVRRQDGDFYIVHRESEASFPGQEDLHNARPGVSVPVRVQDMVAYQLRNIKGAPEFELDWPVADKDKAIAAVIELLRSRGHLLRGYPAKPSEALCRPSVGWEGEP